MSESRKIRIGVSSCLLGAKVRYDGRHKRDAYINDGLGRYFEFLPVCPEVDSGMGVPRDPVRLIRMDDGELKVVGLKNPNIEFTSSLTKFSRSYMPELAALRGYLVKSKSPSCGLEKVRIYTQHGRPAGSGPGIFTSVLMQNYPLLPVEEEGRLCDRVLRNNFVERVFVYDHWLSVVESGLTLGKLTDFHTRHTLLIMSHNHAACRRLGALVVQAIPEKLKEISQSYSNDLMNVLKRPATRKNHVHVLENVFGRLKKFLDGGDKQKIQAILEQYKGAQLPLIVPIKLIRHHFRRHPDPFIEKQFYFHLYVHELIFRNSHT